MTTGRALFASLGRRRSAVAAVALGVAVAVLAGLFVAGRAPAPGPTVGERLSLLDIERATLQARADAMSRIDLIGAFRVASLLSDALRVRAAPRREEAFESLPARLRQDFAALEAVNARLTEAVVRPGEGSRLAARVQIQRAQEALDRMAGDGQPLILQFSPRFVPPRRASNELVLVPAAAAPPPSGNAVRLGSSSPPGTAPGAQGDRTNGDDGPPRTRPEVARPEVGRPIVPRYGPSFVAAAAGNASKGSASTDDPPVAVEIAAVQFDDADAAPALTVGGWRGTASVSPLRLRFAVPRSAFATDAERTTFVTGLLSVRRHGRTETFQLPFVVLPDHPGSVAVDQKVLKMVPESKTLVSPEILARADAGKSTAVRRCFDPPPGWRFDKTQRRVVTVERLGWVDDVSDSTVNAGTVEFAANEKPSQICVVVTARPATKEGRTATIGRFEATLVHDTAQETVVQSGVRALDWNEALRLPIDPDAAEGKLYLRLLGEIDREFTLGKGPLPDGVPFLRIGRADGGKTLVLRADWTAAP